MNLRVTIVTYAWPPRNSIGAHRPYSWAKYWARQGAQVRVLTSVKYPHDEPLDLDLPRLEGVELHEVQYHSVRTDLARSVLAGRAGRLARRAFSAARRFLPRAAHPRAGWRSAALPIAHRLAATSDFVVSTFDPAESHLIALDMKRHNPRLTWIADYRDLWSQNHGVDMGRVRRARLRSFELASVGSFASGATTVSQELAQTLGALLPMPVKVVMNGYDTPESRILHDLSRVKGLCQRPLRIVHTGTVYPRLRDPTPLIDAILKMHDEGELSEGDLVLEFYGRKLGPVERILVTKPAAARFVRIEGYVTRDRAVEVQRGGHALLLLESPLPEAKGVLTGKLFEYLVTGVPILSVGSRADSAIARVLRDTRTGICVGDDLPLMQETLRALLRGGTPTWFAPEVHRLRSYSREHQALLMLDLLQQDWG